MRQVIEDIVTTAKDAMPDGGRIAIRAENVTVQPDSALKFSPGAYVRISVEDTGPGIPAEIHSQIFAPYVTTREGAHGLGLAIC